ncbi:MAG: hypothetical protein JWO06_2895 [Bacteroidota bacterium]|nr:hypothetical protein [Bacteroidota bacterium]
MKLRIHTQLPQSTIAAYIHFLTFTVGLTIFGCLFFILPHQQISVFEKRKLCSFPRFTSQSLFKGSYTDSLDIYVADNFPFRDQLVAVSFGIKNHRGIQSDQVAFYTNTVDDQIPPSLDTASMKTDSTLAPADTAEQNDIHQSNGLLIYKGMAIQMFGGNRPIARQYANAVNKFYEKYKGQAKVYVAVTPTHGEFCLPDDYKKYYVSERKNIDSLYSYLLPEVHKVDIYSQLQKHKDEYIFFNTDHHWTGLGAYYAYSAFCTEAGLTPLRLDQMEKKVIPNFLGSLYWLTRDPKLKDHIDSVIYYKSPAVTTAHAGKSLEKMSKANVYVEFAKGVNSYGVFLGSDYPVMKVETDVKNGRKAVVIKNSYGNPFSTYLVSNFEEVFIVDYRYYNSSLKKLITDNGITDIIFITPTFSANTKWHVSRVASIL